jgi:cation:H+ antiporter
MVIFYYASNKLVYLALIFVFSLILVKSTDILIVNFKSLSQKTQLRKFALTGLILGLGTSLPELFVGVTSGLAGKPSLSLGNVLGANIANLSLVIGGAALIGGTVAVHGTFLRRDVFYAFLAACAPMILLFDKVLSRLDGAILLILYGFYQVVVFGEQRPKAVGEPQSFVERILRKLNHPPSRRMKKELGGIFLGIALVLFSADVLVRISVRLAIAFNFPLFLVGLLIVAVGTTLPELVFGIKALRERQPGMVFGNLLGSIVANGTLIIGLVALISPVRIQAFGEYLLATVTFVIIFGLFYFFIRTKHRLDHWEGAVLLVVYLLFVILELKG